MYSETVPISRARIQVGRFQDRWRDDPRSCLDVAMVTTGATIGAHARVFVFSTHKVIRAQEHLAHVCKQISASVGLHIHINCFAPNTLKSAT